MISFPQQLLGPICERCEVNFCKWQSENVFNSVTDPWLESGSGASKTSSDFLNKI